jgi:DNA anti-recombination protein RmuC
MSDDHITLDLLGRLVRQVQADVRNLRTEQEMLREQFSGGLAAIGSGLLKRIAESEALMETRFDHLDRRMDQTERSMEERLIRIEKLLEEMGDGG